MSASREELLDTARWRRVLAAKARALSLERMNEAAQRSLLRHAADLERQADELEIQAAALVGKWDDH
jgi:hypothetical protein